jgi:hypothetical protein
MGFVIWACGCETNKILDAMQLLILCIGTGLTVQQQEQT